MYRESERGEEEKTRTNGRTEKKYVEDDDGEPLFACWHAYLLCTTRALRIKVKIKLESITNVYHRRREKKKHSRDTREARYSKFVFPV